MCSFPLFSALSSLCLCVSVVPFRRSHELDCAEDADRRPGEVRRHRGRRDVRGPADRAADVHRLRPAAAHHVHDSGHRRRGRFRHGPQRAVHRRTEAADRERSVPRAGRAGRGLGRPLLQGTGPAQARPGTQRRTGAVSASDRPGARRRHPGRRAAKDGSWLAGRPARTRRCHHGRGRVHLSLAERTARERHWQSAGNERPSRRHRRTVRGVGHVPDAADPVYALSSGGAVHPPGTADHVDGAGGRRGGAVPRGSVPSHRGAGRQGRGQTLFEGRHARRSSSG